MKCSFWREGKVESLTEDVILFNSWISPTEEEARKREDVKERVFNIIQKTFSDCSPIVFGSTETGLYSPLSDIDIAVMSLPEGDIQCHIYQLAKVLSNESTVMQMKVIPHAKVPIIKLIDSLTSLQVDICFGVDNGSLKNTEVVKKLLQDYPQAKPVFTVLKYLLAVCGFNEVYTGGIGSYALLLMVVALLQNKKIDSDTPLGDILIEFFRFYGMQFPYDTKGISILGDGEFFSKESRGWYRPSQPHMLSLEDPNNPENDVTRCSYNINLIQTLFSECYRILIHNPTLEYIFPLVHIPYLFTTRKRALKTSLSSDVNSHKPSSRSHNNNREKRNKEENWRETIKVPDSPNSGKRKRENEPHTVVNSGVTSKKSRGPVNQETHTVF